MSACDESAEERIKKLEVQMRELAQRLDTHLHDWALHIRPFDPPRWIDGRTPEYVRPMECPPPLREDIRAKIREMRKDTRDDTGDPGLHAEQG